MRLISLQSGSNGNSIYVEADGVRLLFDAGISGRQAQERLESHGIDIRDVDALLLSHDHRDHTSCAGIYHRKFGLPVYATPGTWRVCRSSLGPVSDTRVFQAGETLQFGHARVRTFLTPHDGAEGVAFVIEADGRRIGILTDLGYVFSELKQMLPTLDAALLESNYDEEMLRRGPYPEFLQERIRGTGGHLSNTDSARLVLDYGKRLQWLVIGHLSEENNATDVAMNEHLSHHGGLCPVYHAGRNGVSAAWEI